MFLWCVLPDLFLCDGNGCSCAGVWSATALHPVGHPAPVLSLDSAPNLWLLSHLSRQRGCSRTSGDAAVCCCEAANQKPQYKHPPFDACSAWTGASTSFTWPSACGLRHTLCSSGRVSFSTVSTQRRGTDHRWVGGRQKVRPLRLMPLRLTIAPGMSPCTLLSAPVRCDDVDISLSLLCSQICSR